MNNNDNIMKCPYPREHLEWRPLPGYEERFEISNYGDIHMLDHIFIDKAGKKWHKKEEYKWSENYQPGGGNHRNYLYVYLSGVNKFYAHRLVASVFLPKPEGKDEVNHKDGNGHNNYCGCKENNYEDSNLEWVTRLENCQHASRTGLINRTSEKRKVAAKKNREKIDYDNIKRPVIQLTLDGQYVAEYPSITDAAKTINKGTTLIGSVLQHNSVHKSAGGFNWIYKDEYDPNKDYSFTYVPGKHRRKKVAQCDLEGKIIKIYDSIKEAAEQNRENNFAAGYIGDCANGKRKTHKGYTWKFVS